MLQFSGNWGFKESTSRWLYESNITKPIVKEVTITHNKLFVYGIFLSETHRKSYGMENPEYDTVKDYLTVGDIIVQAFHCPGAGLALTGLVVDMTPENWPDLDRLEGGYERKEIVTTKGVRAYMYVGR